MANIIPAEWPSYAHIYCPHCGTNFETPRKTRQTKPETTPHGPVWKFQCPQCNQFINIPILTSEWLQYLFTCRNCDKPVGGRTYLIGKDGIFRTTCETCALLATQDGWHLVAFQINIKT